MSIEKHLFWVLQEEDINNDKLFFPPDTPVRNINLVKQRSKLKALHERQLRRLEEQQLQELSRYQKKFSERYDHQVYLDAPPPACEFINGIDFLKQCGQDIANIFNIEPRTLQNQPNTSNQQQQTSDSKRRDSKSMIEERKLDYSLAFRKQFRNCFESMEHNHRQQVGRLKSIQNDELSKLDNSIYSKSLKERVEQEQEENRKRRIREIERRERREIEAATAVNNHTNIIASSYSSSSLSNSNVGMNNMRTNHNNMQINNNNNNKNNSRVSSNNHNNNPNINNSNNNNNYNYNNKNNNNNNNIHININNNNNNNTNSNNMKRRNLLGSSSNRSRSPPHAPPTPPYGTSNDLHKVMGDRRGPVYKRPPPLSSRGPPPVVAATSNKQILPAIPSVTVSNFTTNNSNRITKKTASPLFHKKTQYFAKPAVLTDTGTIAIMSKPSRVMIRTVKGTKVIGDPKDYADAIVGSNNSKENPVTKRLYNGLPHLFYKMESGERVNVGPVSTIQPLIEKFLLNM